MLSVSVRYLLYQPMGEKIKTWPLRFPAEENPNMGKALFDWPIALQYDVKAKYRLISRKFLEHEVFSPERSLNQPKATRVCIRSINQSNRSISVRLLFLFCSRVFISRSYENRSKGWKKIPVQTSVFISESRTARDTNSHFKIPNAFKSNSLKKKNVLELISTCSLKATDDESHALPRAWMSHNDSRLLSLNFPSESLCLKSSFNHSNVGESICRDQRADNIAKSMRCLPRTDQTFESARNPMVLPFK